MRNISRAEHEVLRCVLDEAPVTARQVADRLSESRGLARTTVLTLLERLRKKGHLVREEREGVYEYSPAAPKQELQRSLVGDFVDRVLGGSVSPIAAYLAQRDHISEDELAELKRIVDNLDATRKERQL